MTLNLLSKVSYKSTIRLSPYTKRENNPIKPYTRTFGQKLTVFEGSNKVLATLAEIWGESATISWLSLLVPSFRQLCA